MQLRCPICNKVIRKDNSKNKEKEWLPFCSERCKMIDLGAWLDADYRIPLDQNEQKLGDVDNTQKQ
jgi:hypothetical protein